MTPTRLKVIFRTISIAFNEGHGDVAKQCVSYGAFFKITKQEVKEVLRMSLPEIYSKMYTKKTTIPIRIPKDTAEGHPVIPMPVEH